MQSLFQGKQSSSGNERFSICYLSFLQRNIRMMMVWWWWAEKGPAMGCGWGAPAVALPEAHTGATSNVCTCKFLCFLHSVLLDEGFMCKIWCFRAGWNWWWKHCCFPHQSSQPAVLGELQLVEMWSLWSSLRWSPDPVTKARTIPSIQYFCLTWYMKLTLLPHLTWLQCLWQCHFFFSNATVFRFTIHLLTVSE